MPFSARENFYVIGGASVALLFIGIHNSWDTVTYQLLTRQELRRRQHEQEKEQL